MSKKRNHAQYNKKVLTKLKSNVKNLQKQQGKLTKLEKKIEVEERAVLKEEKKILAAEKRIHKDTQIIMKQEKEVLFMIGRFKVLRSHMFDIIKIIAGALIGSGIGTMVIGRLALAESLPWLNIVAMIVIVLCVGGLLVYKAEREKISHMNHPAEYIVFRVLYIWLIATLISGITALLFVIDPISTSVGAKLVLLSSFPAVSGAIGFSFL